MCLKSKSEAVNDYRAVNVHHAYFVHDVCMDGTFMPFVLAQ